MESCEEYLLCPVCGKRLKFINGVHLKTHGLSTAEFKSMFPGHLFIAPSVSKQMSKSRTGKRHTQKTKDRMRDSHKDRSHPWMVGDKNWMCSPEGRAWFAENNPMKRPEQRERMSRETAFRRADVREANSRRMSGENNPSKRPAVRRKQSRSRTELYRKRPELLEAFLEAGHRGWRAWFEANPTAMSEFQQMARKGPTRIERVVEGILERNHFGFEPEVRYLMLLKSGKVRTHRVDFLVTVPRRVVVECDGCYWHGCPDCFPSVDENIVLVMERDREVTEAFSSSDVKFLRFWEHDINSRPEWVEAQIREVVGCEVTRAHL